MDIDRIRPIRENFKKCSKRSKESININDFLLLCVIGKGSYAKVVLVRKKDTREIFALKVLKKKFIEQRNQKVHVKSERSVLTTVSHPFIIKLQYAFQNERKLFFAMEYCPGGELFALLQKRKTFTEDQARFYAAQILLAIVHLHENDIIYRDLKPENVLIDKDGYIRLADFGLSKRGVKGNKDAKSVCGTPEYLAPEVLLRAGHGKAVDWWTFGSILYEMLCGLPPFYSSDREELFYRIKFSRPKFPDTLSAKVKDLLEGLFEKNPEKRLGSQNGDGSELFNHPWFRNIDWSTLLQKKYKPPFVPIIRNELDVSNFDLEFTQSAVNSLQDITSTENSTCQSSYPDWSFNGDACSILSSSSLKCQDKSFKISVF